MLDAIVLTQDQRDGSAAIQPDKVTINTWFA